MACLKKVHTMASDKKALFSKAPKISEHEFDTLKYPTKMSWAVPAIPWEFRREFLQLYMNPLYEPNGDVIFPSVAPQSLVGPHTNIV